MYNFSPSAPPYSPTLSAQNSLPPYEDTPFLSATSNSLLSFYRSGSISDNCSANVPNQEVPQEVVVPPARYESIDDTLEKYKGFIGAAIAVLVLISFVASLAALYCTFAGFTLLPLLGGVVDEENKKTNLTFLFGTVGTMVGLYQTDVIKEIMNATVAQIGWDWDNMSNTTHEFLSFNVAITLSIMAGVLAQALVYGAIAAKDEHSRNRMRI